MAGTHFVLSFVGENGNQVWQEWCQANKTYLSDTLRSGQRSWLLDTVCSRKDRAK
jgi:hypothetical protein